MEKGANPFEPNPFPLSNNELENEGVDEEKKESDPCKRAHYFSTSFSNYCGRKYEIMCSVFHVIPEYAKLCSN